MARARRKAADTATKTSPEKAREEAGAPRAPLEQNAEKKRKPRASQKGDRKRVRVSEGVYRDRYGLAATVKVNGIQRERRFPRETGMRTIQVWRTQTRASLQNLPKGAKHTLAHDAKRYLDEKKGQLASIRDRRRNLGTWFEKFGHIRTLTLEHHVNELNGQLRQWRKTLSGATCNHRRDALMNLVRVLYGDRAASGLSELKTFKKEPAAQAQGAEPSGDRPGPHASGTGQHGADPTRTDALDRNAAGPDGEADAGNLLAVGTQDPLPARRRRAGRGTTPRYPT